MFGNDGDEPLSDIDGIDSDAEELETGQDGGEGQGEDEEEFSIEIEGEEQAEETPLIKTLRQEIRDTKQELHKYRAASAQPKIEVGEKPSLESCEWDEERYEAELDAWKERGRAAAKQEQDELDAQNARAVSWSKTVQNYQLKAAALKVSDFQQAEETLKVSLPEILQSALLAYADDPAKVGYALYKHPARLAALAQETDPIKFVIAVRDLERNLKVVNRRNLPPPDSETFQKGSAPTSGPKPDKKAESLLAAAEKDPTKFAEYRSYMRSKKQA